MRKIEVKIRYAIWAFRKAFKPSPAYRAKMGGLMWDLRNDTHDEYVWTLVNHGIDADLVRTGVHASEFKTVIPSIRIFIARFKEMYCFQMTSWFIQDSCKTLGRRISYISSNNIQFG